MRRTETKDLAARASKTLGIECDEEGHHDHACMGELKIENERLKTTLMILNQKMKMQEDSEDLNEKWKT